MVQVLVDPVDRKEMNLRDRFEDLNLFYGGKLTWEMVILAGLSSFERLEEIDREIMGWD